MNKLLILDMLLWLVANPTVMLFVLSDSMLIALERWMSRLDYKWYCKYPWYEGSILFVIWNRIRVRILYEFKEQSTAKRVRTYWRLR